MKKLFSIFISAVLFILFPYDSTAQSTIIFRVDMSTQMKNSTFIPSQNTIEITGDQLPFSKTRTIRMKIKSPQDSVYIAKVRFPSIVNGRELTYNFVIKKGYHKIADERNQRLLTLGKEDKNLSVVGFNEFEQ